MKIASYIQELLFDHSCVIVPGFGGFLTEERSAQINPISNLFQAPSLSLAFNASLTKDDGLLKSEVSMGEGISLDQALEDIKTFVFSIENELKLNNETSIEGLGVFSEQDGIINYKPQAISNHNIEGFGLEEFKLEPIDRNTEDMKHTRPVPPARRVVKRTPTATKTVEVAEKIVKEKEDVPNRKSIFLLLPILLFVIGGGIAGYSLLSKGDSHEMPIAGTEINEESVSHEQASLLGSSSTESISSDEERIVETEEELDGNETSSHSVEAVDDEIDYSSNHESVEIDEVEEAVVVEDAVVHEENVVVEEVVSSSAVTEANGRFHVIAGVYNSMENAEKFTSKHDGTSILEIGGYFKVSVGNFTTINKAANSLNELQSKYGSDVWITKH